MKIRISISILVVAFSLAATGQSDTARMPGIRITYHHGYLLPHHKSISFYIEDYINGIEVNIPLALFMNRNHKKQYRMLETGIGYYYSNLGNKNIYGHNHGGFYYIDYPVFRKSSKWNLYHKTAMGMGYVTRPFDIVENPFNRAIGSYLNFFFIFGADISWQVTPRLRVYGGPSLVHNSNGNLKMPNFGMNLITGHAGLQYQLQEPATRQNNCPDEAGWEKHRFDLIATAFPRQVSRRLPEMHVANSLILEYYYNFRHNKAFGVGVDAFRNPADGKEPYVTGEDIPVFNPWYGGIHGSYLITVNRLSFIFATGYKIFDNKESEFRGFNRAGVRYRFAGPFYINFCIKAHRFAADYVETGIGVNFYQF